MSHTPIIGITVSSSVDQLPHGTFNRIVLSRNYVDAVAAAGGHPILLPSLPDSTDDLLHFLDGIIFSGGPDIDPRCYGDRSIHPDTYGIDPPRDQFEFNLLRSALERDLSVLCICRGIQTLNVALGGTLYQDIADQVGLEVLHQQNKAGIDATEGSHGVILEPNTRLVARYAQPEIMVNSFHHQAIRDLAEPLRIAGLAPDGVIEAVEMPSRSFVVGVQWHPELMYTNDPQQLALFSGLVEAARMTRSVVSAH